MNSDIMQNLIDNVPSIISICDVIGRFTMVNRAFLTAYNFAHHSEAIGLTDYDIHPEERARLVTEFDNLVIKTKQPRQREIILETIKGQRHLVVRKIPIFGANGEVEQVCSIGTDVTDTRILETREQEEYQQTAIKSLVAGVSHDINNSLGVALGNLALLQRTIGEDTASRRIQAAQSAVKTISSLTQQLQAIAGRTSVHQDWINVDQFISKRIPMIQSAVSADLNLKVDLESNSIIQADPERFISVILNLVSNARHAIGNRRPGRIELSTRRPRQDTLELSVTDNGQGVPAALKEKILQPFFTTKPRGQGSGLGLAMVKSFAEGAHGSVRIQDATPGTTVLLELPVVKMPEEASTDNAAVGVSTRSHDGSVTALLVDDNVDLLGTTAALLDMLFVQVVVASGIDSVESIIQSDTNIDIAFLDLRMPDVNGFQLTHIVRAWKPNLPIVMCSGDFQNDDIEAAKRHNINVLLDKPFGVNDLARALIECGLFEDGEIMKIKQDFQGQSDDYR